MTNGTSNDQATEHMMDLRGCVNAIDTMVTAYGKSDENRESMDRIIKHIESIRAMPHIAGSGIDLSPYQRAIDLGRSWLAQD